MDFSKYKRVVFSLAASSLLLVGLFLLLDGAPRIARAAPGDLFVTTDGSGPGCTQANPCDLATALNQSADGDTVYVAQGTYTSAGTAVVTVTKSITLFGGWDASMTTPPVCDPEIYPTTLDGENARRGVYISGDITPTLDGFIVTRGNASNAATDPGYGGGIYSNGAHPIVTNNVITNNVAYSSTISWAHGGGIYVRGSYGAPVMAVISGNVIANNAASTAYLGEGGGLEVRYGSDVIVSNNTFQGNIAGATNNGKGGGLSLHDTSAVVSGNLVQNNQATPTGAGFGGGFYIQFGDVTLSGNTVISNAAQYGAVTLEYNTNVALTNNVIAQNPAGGVFVRGSASSPLAGILVHNTIAQNGKEGVYAGWYSSGYSSLTLTNNIIVSHTTGIYAYPDLNPNVVTATHTLFYGNDDDTDGSTITSTDEIIDSDPLFLDSAGWNYHLRPDSPAIDTGATVPWLTTDVDGDARPWPTGGDYDIGADEAHWRSIYLPLVLKSSG
jgi:putative cofactor-binding repeat protein